MDAKVYANARSEIRFEGNGVVPKFQDQFTTWGMSFKMYVPPDFKSDPVKESILQLKDIMDECDLAGGNPPFKIGLVNSDLSATVRYTSQKCATELGLVFFKRILEVQPGKWHYFVLNIGWDYRDNGNGFVELFARVGAPPTPDDLVVDYKGPTGYNNNFGHYLKLGIYKWLWKVQSNVDKSRAAGVDKRVLYYDDINIVKNGINISPNQPPSANAGLDQNITLPNNQVTINGTGSDTDGTIASYRWDQLSGPDIATLSGENSPNLQAGNLVEGTYVFRLKVIDDHGATGFDETSVTVQPAPNQGPTANAGPDQTVNLPDSQANLNGSASDPDGTIASYLWEQLSGPDIATLSGENSPNLVASDLVEGSYSFRFNVTDDHGVSAFDKVTVAVLPAPNQEPIVNAGPNYTISLPTSQITINGSASDPDGSIVSQQWSQESGPGNATLTNSGTLTLEASDLIEGVYGFKLTVTDNQGATASDKLFVEVLAAPNQAPIVDAGRNKTVTLPDNQVTLNGTASDPDGSITSYLWEQVSGPNTATLSGDNTKNLDAINLIEGSYIFRLSVVDDGGIDAYDELMVKVEPASNQAPTVDAGSNQTIELPTDQVILNGSASDPDGTVVSYQWEQVSGPNNAILSGEDTSDLQANNLIEGSYVFRLNVTDDFGTAVYDEVMVTVQAIANQMPIADAGPNITIVSPENQVTLNGTGSDPDGSISAYLWDQVSGPNTASLNGKNTPDLQAGNLMVGSYLFRFTVVDDLGASARDSLKVEVVTSSSNQLPAADAGPNQNLILPENQVTLNGTASDPDGLIASYLWEQLSGPNTASLSGINSPDLQAGKLVEGSYIFRFNVTDEQGGSAQDEVSVNVYPAANQTPIADAGSNQNITLPDNQVTINGTASDPDGSIISYSWEQVSGPSAANLSGVNTTELQAGNLLEGSYIFKLTVADDQGASAYDEVTVTVQPVPNQAPVADAGPNQNLTLPENQITLNGTASDQDGLIAGYQWEQISGPSTASLNGANSPDLLAADLVEGTYVFRLNISDDQGAGAYDEVAVKVLPVPNQAPVADAGPNKTIVLPENQVIMNGTASDPDGSIAGFEWEQLSGPNQATLAGVNSSELNAGGLMEGTYNFQLTVTDDKGEHSSDQVEIKVLSAPPVITADITHATCNSNNGSISLTLTGGKGPFDFEWSNGSTTKDLSNLTSGSYTVRVTDQNGNSTSNTFIVDAQQPEIIVSAEIRKTSCSKQDGQIRVTTGGGTGPYDYSWSNGQKTQTINNLVAGEYELMVTDKNGCVKNVSFEVETEPGETEFEVISEVNYTSCAGSDGSIYLTVPGDNGTYNYTWSNGSKGTSLTGLDIGSYQVLITDEHGCFMRKDFIIYQISQETPEITQNGDVLSLNIEADYYQWYKEGIVIEGANQKQLQITETGNYIAQVSFGENCTSTSEPFRVNNLPKVSSNTDEYIQEVDYYPNPVRDYLTIQIQLYNETEAAYIIYDAYSNIVLKKELGTIYGEYTEQIDLSLLPTGVYLLKIEAGEEILTRRIIKK